MRLLRIDSKFLTISPHQHHTWVTKMIFSHGHLHSHSSDWTFLMNTGNTQQTSTSPCHLVQTNIELLVHRRRLPPGNESNHVEAFWKWISLSLPVLNYLWDPFRVTSYHEVTSSSYVTTLSFPLLVVDSSASWIPGVISGCIHVTSTVFTTNPDINSAVDASEIQIAMKIWVVFICIYVVYQFILLFTTKLSKYLQVLKSGFLNHQLRRIQYVFQLERQASEMHHQISALANLPTSAVKMSQNVKMSTYLI